MSDLKRVLLVDDEPDIQAIAKLSLEKVGGFTSLICSSGHEAIDQISGFKPDIVLLDVMMPDLDGPNTLKQLQEKNLLNDTPVVFFTAKVLNSEIEELKELGAEDVISKPFDPMTLPTQLKDIWSRINE
ncbi:response regulator [Idiomarina sp. PL1-037]|uniref:response regulator n=1 Tax=Idiomarina sp. PL1-037 TaxID=3095365 RepID=UPI002ACBDAF1|nr:response regulator [Idiomarina sp. PL1-037]WQC53637.1 response regulator [Idiomarina sp. PL1-037]